MQTAKFLALPAAVAVLWLFLAAGVLSSFERLARTNQELAARGRQLPSEVVAHR